LPTAAFVDTEGDTEAKPVLNAGARDEIPLGEAAPGESLRVATVVIAAATIIPAAPTNATLTCVEVRRARAPQCQLL
jgi:hypothetical protein